LFLIFYRTALKKCKIGDYKVKDALKFFQGYINEMIDIGGDNLPKSISTSLGAKLGKLYKEREPVSNMKARLTQIYTVLDAKVNITKLDENIYEVIVEHLERFCPIGGSYNPTRAPIFQSNICFPYTTGFLNEILPEFKTSSEIKNCILSNNQKTCHYILKLEKKKNVI